MKYLRTFIALPLKVEDDFLLARSALMEKLAGERISWVEPLRFHVTIRFLGSTPPDLVTLIGKSLKEKLEVPQRTHIDFAGAGSFGPGKKPRVVWVGFKNSLFMEGLKVGVDGVLEKCGVNPDKQPFRAHLTLGRIRGLKDLKTYYRLIDSMKEQFYGRVLADRLVYYRSDLKSGGPEYTVLEEVLFPDQPF